MAAIWWGGQGERQVRIDRPGNADLRTDLPAYPDLSAGRGTSELYEIPSAVPTLFGFWTGLNRRFMEFNR